MLSSSDSDANDLSRNENLLFEAPSHSVEQWAYGYRDHDEGNTHRYEQDGTAGTAAFEYARSTRTDNVLYYNEDDQDDINQSQRNQYDQENAGDEMSHTVRNGAGAGAGGRRTKKVGRKKKVGGNKSKKKAKAKAKSSVSSRNGSSRLLKSKSRASAKISRLSRSSLSSKRKKGKSSHLFKQSREVWRPAPAKSPTKSQRTTILRRAQDASSQSLSPQKKKTKKPSVSRLNLSNLNRMSSSAVSGARTTRTARTGGTGGTGRAAMSPTPTARSKKLYNALNRSGASARSFSGLSISSQRSTMTRRGKSSKEAASLRLRLAGTHNAIRALQEQLHERTAEVDELRAQLLSKTRALEAARSFANAGNIGSLDRSYSSRASGHASGHAAQSKRKYEAKLQVFEKECDQAVTEARKKQQRAIEINADLRAELERLRSSASSDEQRLQDMRVLMDDAQRALDSERKYTASLVAQQQQQQQQQQTDAYNGGEDSFILSAASNIDDLMTPDVTVRMLRQEVSRLRAALSKTTTEHAHQEQRVLQASGRSKQLEKENSVLRNRVDAAGSFGRTIKRTTKATSKKLSRTTRTNITQQQSKSKSKSKSTKKVLGPSNGVHQISSTTRTGIVQSAATKSTVEAQRYAKLKRMYDRALG